MRARGLSTRRTLAVGAAGAAVIGLGLGSVFGLRAFAEHGDPAATCRTTPCSAESVSLNDRAKFAADAATVSVVSGVVLLAAAAVLWWSE